MIKIGKNRDSDHLKVLNLVNGKIEVYFVP